MKIYSINLCLLFGVLSWHVRAYVSHLFFCCLYFFPHVLFSVVLHVFLLVNWKNFRLLFWFIYSIFESFFKYRHFSSSSGLLWGWCSCPFMFDSCNPMDYSPPGSSAHDIVFIYNSLQSSVIILLILLKFKNSTCFMPLYFLIFINICLHFFCTLKTISDKGIISFFTVKHSLEKFSDEINPIVLIILLTTFLLFPDASNFLILSFWFCLEKKLLLALLLW